MHEIDLGGGMNQSVQWGQKKELAWHREEDVQEMRGL